MKLGSAIANNTIYKFCNILISFLTTIFIARIINVSGYGFFSLLVANAAVFNLITSFGADSAISYHTASNKISSSSILGIVWSIIIIQIIVLSIIEIFRFVIFGKFFLFNTSNFYEIWIGLVFVLSISVIDKYSALYLGKHLFHLCNKIILFSNSSFLIFIGVIFYHYRDIVSSILVVSAYVISFLLQALILLLFWHLRIANSKIEIPRKVSIKYFFSYSMIALIANIFQFMAYRIDYWILEYFKGEEQLGWYSLAVKLAQVYWIIPGVCASIILARIASFSTAYDIKQTELIVRVVNFVNLILSLTFFFGINFLVKAIFKDKFDPSITLFRILMVGHALFSITIIIASQFAGEGKLLYNLKVSILCFTAIFLFDLLLIPRFGMIGASIASTIGYSVSAATNVYFFCVTKRRKLSNLFSPNSDDFTFIKKLLRYKS